ncbi:FG-GAP repeat protein [Streptomyces sp. NBC_01433]|uniref:FG-GAP and VCBS repeat-containing protein n=1 Tax=Streptomyces sp. NBC_01433 TaxID=2903864 RepID=UPI002B1CBD14|nr:FG-GAP repeat protein [Streptomyces sp. NBC_01433]
MAGHSSRTRRIAALAAMTAVAAGLSGGTAHAAPMPVPQDINGDGYQDLVVPAPAATVKGLDYAGSVVVLYGSAKGVSAAKRAVISRSSPGVPGAAEAGDRFGASASLADLDRDGFADLVVGAPGEHRFRDGGGFGHRAVGQQAGPGVRGHAADTGGEGRAGRPGRCRLVGTGRHLGPDRQQQHHHTADGPVHPCGKGGLVHAAR